MYPLALSMTCWSCAALMDWFSPGPTQLVDALEGVVGKHAARRSGAKGVCASGFFVGTADGRGLSNSSIFSGQEIPVIARFSVGLEDVADLQADLTQALEVGLSVAANC